MSFIGLVKGNPGSGKTFGAYSFPEPICHILLENRKDFYTQQKEIYYPGKLIDIKECYKTKQDGIFSTHDVLGSLQHLQSTFRSINLNQYQTIILDHAGRIRKWLIEEWCIRHHKKNVWPLDEYRVINANTRVYLAGLINAGKESDKNIILTTTYEDEYGTVEDDRGKMNRSLLDTGGAMLVVSQFTLMGDCRKGRRPSFTGAAPPDRARQLYEAFVKAVKQLGVATATGRFQSHMEVALVNDGPVTLMVESPLR